MTTLLAAILVLGILILVHELGHFWAAKAVDIEVPRFSIGIGPKLVGFRRGETEYVLSWLPLGGYVRMAGMGEEEALEGVEGRSGGEGRPPSDRDFDAKPLWARFLTISAGVLMNFLFAVAAFGTLAAVWGVPRVPEARIGDVVEERLPPSAIPLARLPRGARVESVNGQAIDDWEDLTLTLGMVPAGSVRVRAASHGEVAFELAGSDSVRTALLTALEPVREMEPVLGEIVEGGAADSVDIRPGDRVVAVEGRPVESWQELARAVEERPGLPTRIALLRGGQRHEVVLAPAERRLVGEGDTLRYGRIGVTPGSAALAAEIAASGLRSVGPVEALRHGFAETWSWTRRTVEVVVRLVTGEAATDNLAGPVRIVQASGDVAALGAAALLRFMAVLSVNLAILNLLPVPVLDGGHLMFLLVEAVRGRAVSVETRVRLTQVGLLLVGALMVWAIGNDLLHIFG